MGNSVEGYMVKSWSREAFCQLKIFYALSLKEGSLASIWRYRPTPESSEGAGEDTGLFMAGTGVFVAALACEVLRDRLEGIGKGVRVLVSQAGRVMVDLA